MMKLAIYAKNNVVKKTYKEHIKQNGFEYSGTEPDIVISLGGDGTFLNAERKYPGIPKLLIRDSRICKKCNLNLFDDFIDFLNTQYVVTNHRKLKVEVKTAHSKHELLAVNDCIIRNKLPIYAIRFEMHYEKTSHPELIGDGVVVATPFGSEAYFQSITGKYFSDGLGIAFNNLTNRIQPKVISEDAIIRLRMLRNPAYLAVDNDQNLLVLKPGDTVKISMSDRFAKLIEHK